MNAVYVLLCRSRKAARVPCAHLTYACVNLDLVSEEGPRWSVRHGEDDAHDLCVQQSLDLQRRRHTIEVQSVTSCAVGQVNELGSYVRTSSGIRSISTTNRSITPTSTARWWWRYHWSTNAFVARRTDGYDWGHVRGGWNRASWTLRALTVSKSTQPSASLVASAPPPPPPPPPPPGTPPSSSSTRVHGR